MRRSSTSTSGSLLRDGSVARDDSRRRADRGADRPDGADPAARLAADAELAARLTSGDPSAEAELIAHFQSPLRTMIRRRVKDAALAEDLCQETFRVALAALREGRLREGEKLTGYLWGIATNLTSRQRRLRAREASPAGLADPLDATPTIEDRLLESERAGLLRRALARLAPRDREVLHAFYLANASKASICEHLNLSPAQFDVIKHRALKRLAAVWRGGRR